MDSHGQLMMIGFDGPEPSDELLSFVGDEHIGGVILFKRNYRSVKQLKGLINKLKDASGGHLLIAIDHEGGRVTRLGKPFTQFPCALELAKLGGRTVYEAGQRMGQELSEVGINLNFAPVLDVATNAFNTVIGDRSFGSDPLFVAELGLQMMQGLLDGGVIPCGKHFPGHGDTDLDSHLALPLLHHTKKRFDICELHPFREAIAAGIPMIMTGHILAPNLDANMPASISRRITTGILRKELGFKGVIITDDLLMNGITNLMPVPDAACLAIKSGADMVMVCEDFEMQKKVLDALKRSYDNGELNEFPSGLRLFL